MTVVKGRCWRGPQKNFASLVFLVKEEEKECSPSRTNPVILKGVFPRVRLISLTPDMSPTAVPWMWDWKQTKNSKHKKGKRIAPEIVGEVGG